MKSLKKNLVKIYGQDINLVCHGNFKSLIRELGILLFGVLPVQFYLVSEKSIMRLFGIPSISLAGFERLDRGRLLKFRGSIVICSCHCAKCVADIESHPQDGELIFVDASRMSVGVSEVISSLPSTLVDLEIKLPSGKHIILGMRFPTQKYVSQNNQFCENALLSLVIEVLEADVFRNWVQQRNTHFRKKPGLASFNLFNYVFSVFKALARNIGLSVPNSQAQWGIAYSNKAWRQALEGDFYVIPNPEGRNLADPFVIIRDGRRYIFVEDIELTTGRGSISVVELNSSSKSSVVRCIVEDFHLSFPFLFMWEGNLYMLPETAEIGEIRIYKCTKFPNEWVHERTIMRSVNAVDCMMVNSGDYWWLLAGISPLGKYGRMSDVQAFYGESPLSDTWNQHHSKFIVRNSENGRNGGLIQDDSVLYRIGQQFGRMEYGKSFTVSAIKTLKIDSYREHSVFRVEPEGSTTITGVHTLSTDADFTALDFKSTKTLGEGSKIKFHRTRL